MSQARLRLGHVPRTPTLSHLLIIILMYGLQDSHTFPLLQTQRWFLCWKVCAGGLGLNGLANDQLLRLVT